MNDNFGIIFIHGAGLGSFIWNVMKLLINYPVLAIDFPNREVIEKINYNLTFDDYTKSAVEQIEKFNKDKIIIVTHSIGGCLDLKLTDYFKDKITGFVGIGSIFPSNGKSFVSCFPFPQNYLMPLILRILGTKPPKKSIEQELCNDLTPEQTSEIVKRFTPEAKRLYTTNVHHKNIASKTLYIKLNNDKSLSLQLQEKMAKEMNIYNIATLDSGHLPMISRPKELADILNDFVKNVIR